MFAFSSIKLKHGNEKNRTCVANLNDSDTLPAQIDLR